MAEITRLSDEREKAILKKMLRKEDFERKIIALKAAADDIKKYSIINELIDMFSEAGIECRPDENIDYYEELVRNSEFPSVNEIIRHIINIMYENFMYYPKPEDYMQRITDSCCDEWKEDSLKLRILKQYIKYGSYSSYKKTDPATGREKTVTLYSGKSYITNYIKEKTGKKSVSLNDVLENLDDGIFDRYFSENPGSCKLIKLCDSLAKGIFRAGASTKRDLYYFAMIFNMTYIPKTEYQDKNVTDGYEKDFEKNLFEDYYSNNLSRFIISEYLVDDEAMGGFEMDPSGMGINFKNFQEVVYTYYISKNYEPTDKIKLSEEMIDRLKMYGKTQEFENDTNTLYAKYRFSVDRVLYMSETEFEEYVKKQYKCSDKGMNENAEQNTAYSVFKDILEGIDVSDCDRGLWFTELDKKEEYKTGNLSKYIDGEIDNEKMNKFINMIYGIDKFLSNVRVLSATNEKNVTRTKIASAFYNRYLIENAENRNTGKSFTDIYKDFTNTVTGLNYYYEEIGYQPISSKNIFDMAIMFGAYIYLNHWDRFSF